MGGLIETDKMLMHIKSCAECQAAGSIFDRCGDWREMAENVMDWQCEEGAFENGEDICDVCDRPVVDGSHCTSCSADDHLSGENSNNVARADHAHAELEQEVRENHDSTLNDGANSNKCVTSEN